MKIFNFKKIQLNKKEKIVFAVITVLLLIIGGVTAKYVYDGSLQENYFSAHDFYFTIDLLGDTHKKDDLTRTIELFGGSSQEIAFDVQNYFDDERISEKDTKYTISVECDNKDFNNFKLYKSDEEIASGTQITMQGGVKVTDIYKMQIDYGYEVDTTINVRVKSSEPYTKEMCIKIILHPHGEDVLYRVEDSVDAPYATLIVMASVDIHEGGLNVDWTEINKNSNMLMVDTTNNYVLNDDLTLDLNNPGSSYLSSFKNAIDIKTLESISVYFFKADASKDYSTVGDCAASKNSDGTYTITLTERGQEVI